jgi:hypothetical protein
MYLFTPTQVQKKLKALKTTAREARFRSAQGAATSLHL